MKKRIYKWFKAWVKQTSTESKRVRDLRKSRLSDIQRWSKANVMHDNWQDRTVLLSRFIKDHSSVVEFGAGNAILEEVLNQTISYQPVDIVKRKEHYLVCDLNVHPVTLDLTPYDTALFSGVLEYVYDLDPLFLALSKSVKYIPLSYACSDICTQNRLNNGWLSDYSSFQLEAIFDKYSFRIIKKELWKDQSLSLIHI